MFGPGSGPIFLDGVQCNGTEEKLMDCFHASIGHHACGHLDIETQHDFDVAIMCKGIIISVYVTRSSKLHQNSDLAMYNYYLSYKFAKYASVSYIYIALCNTQPLIFPIVLFNVHAYSQKYIIM